MPTRPGCDKDEYVYYTFWPILAFSFFIASDEILSPDRWDTYEVEPWLLGAVLFVKVGVHMMALNCLCLSILEAFLAFQYLERPLCSRLYFVEADAFLSAMLLILLTLLTMIETLYEPNVTGPRLEGQYRFILQFIPWISSIGVLIYQTYRILTHHF